MNKLIYNSVHIIQYYVTYNFILVDNIIDDVNDIFLNS